MDLIGSHSTFGRTLTTKQVQTIKALLKDTGRGREALLNAMGASER
jgi:hypothetical protein